MMNEEKNRWRNAGNGGSLGTRPNYGITLTLVLVFIIAIGLSQCAEEPHSTTPPTPSGPSPSPESKLERAKSILGVTDQPLRERPPSPHLQGTPDIRKIITSMRKGYFAKKSQASVHQGFPADTTSPGKPNEGLIKSILKAVSDAGEAGKREVERGKERDSEAGKEVPLSSTRGEEESGKVTHGGDEGRSKGKGKLLKAIKEVVLSVEELPEEPEILTYAPSPTEDVEEAVEGKVDKAGGPVSSEVLDSVEVTEVVQKEVESGVSGVGDSEGGREIQETEGKSENTEKQEERVGKETDGESEGKGTSEKNKRTAGDSEEKEMDGASESKETEAESNNKGTRGETVDQERQEREVVRNSEDTWKEEEAGGTSITPITAGEGNKGVQPLGKGVEVVTEALGVLDVKVAPAFDNTSISPAPVVAGRRNILSKKSDVTLSHILGAKEFFSHFPAENFTYLHTSKPRQFYPKLSYKDTTVQEETGSQHKTEPEPAEEKASEPVELRTEDSAGDHGAQEVSRSSTQTKTQKTEDGEDTQERLDDAVPPFMETVGKTEASPVEETDKERTEVDEEEQQQRQQELPQVESTKKDNILKPSSNDTEVKNEAQYPRESVESVDTEAKKVIEVPLTASDQPTDLETTTEGNVTAETRPSAPESKKVSEETLVTEMETDAVATVNMEVGATEDTLTEQPNMTEKEKEVHLVPEAEEEKEDRDKPVGDGDISGEVSKKKKTSEPEKAKRKEAPEKTTDSIQEPSDTLETYSQFTQRVNAEKKNDIISNGHGSNGHGKGPKVKSKNYASPDCGSKLMAANPEASHSSKVIHSNKDEYLLNKCRDKTWFIIELCESIRPQKFDIANFELFSNLPKDIHVLGSHRYPSREWTPLARARGQEGNRGVQSFPVETEDFFKYIKVEVHSHYGSEFFCPISLFRIYGLSEFEVIDTAEEPEEPEEPEEVFSGTPPEEKRSKEEGKPSVIPAVIKNMFSGVLDVIKRGYRPHSSASEPDGSCYSLQPKHAVDKRTCQLADSLNYILSCYHAEYQVLMRQSFVSHTVKNSGFCRLLASTMCMTPEVSDSIVYDTACNSSYLCIMLSPKHTLAMCFMHDSRIMDSQVACESTGTLLPENFSTATPTILPPENGMPTYLKNAKMNTSTITRTDATVPNASSHEAREGLVYGQDKDAKQVVVEHVSVGPEEASSSEPVDASATEASKPEKGQAAGGTQDQAVREAEQPDNSTAPEEAVQMEGSGFVGLEPSEDESAREEEKQEEELPLPVTPLPVEPKVSSTSPTNKESVVVRLSNKIKALEYNMSISSQYLEELSRRYKQQMEEMQRQFNLTIAALNATSHQAFERDQHHQHDIETLEEHLASVSAILSKLVDERESLAHTVVEQHLLLMVVEVVVLCVVFVLCHKRTTRHRLLQLEGQDRRAQTPSEDPSDRQVLGGSSSWSRGRVRRRSVDSITRERSARQRRCRRPSEEALRISGTYEDLLIIEPAIPIMVDSVSDRKKKKKSSSGTLKRSKSNASIVEKSCNSTRRSRRIENLDMSSAGVLFCGDQVDSREAPIAPRTDPSPPHPSRTPQEPAVSVNITSSKPLVEEVMSDSYSHFDTQMVSAKRHSVTGCQNSESIIRKGAKLSKSHSISCTTEKLRNNADKKKIKKLKKKNISQEGQHHFIHESEVCEQTSRTTYNGYAEHIPEYYYNGRNSVHFSETADNVTNHMFNTDVADDNSYVNGSEDLGYVGSDCMHSGYTTNLPDRQRPFPAARVKLRSNNWEWYSLQQYVSSSETVSTSSDSSGKILKGKCRDVPQTVEQSNEKKGKKKKKSKSRSPVVLEEETNGGT